MDEASRKSAARYLLTHPAEFGRRLGYPDLRDDLHGKWMLRMLTESSDMTLQAHRGSYKTTCLCIVIALMMLIYRDKNIIFLRKTDTDVKEVVNNVERILLHPLTRSVFRTLTDTDLQLTRATDSEITTNAYSAPIGAAQLFGLGIGASLTGKHSDIVITDDIVNLRDRLSAAERERTKAAYRELQNIKKRSGRIINTGTPWHKDDAFSIMPQPDVYDCYTTGMIDAETLEKLRNSMTPSLFAANYELRHIASEDALFPETAQFTDDETMLYDGIAHIDASYGGEDYTAFTCAARVNDKIYAYGRIWHAHVDTVLDEIVNDCKHLRCEPIYCETNADKGYLSRELRKRDITTRMYAEKMNKYYKISTFLRKWWANIVWLDGTDPAYLAQIQDYTQTAEHDDAPDSAACICRTLDRKE